MTEHDQTEYAFKNGYTTACDEIYAIIKQTVDVMDIDSHCDFEWGQRNGLKWATRIIKTLKESKS